MKNTVTIWLRPTTASRLGAAIAAGRLPRMKTHRERDDSVEVQMPRSLYQRASAIGGSTTDEMILALLDSLDDEDDANDEVDARFDRMRWLDWKLHAPAIGAALLALTVAGAYLLFGQQS